MKPIISDLKGICLTYYPDKKIISVLDKSSGVTIYINKTYCFTLARFLIRIFNRMAVPIRHKKILDK